MKDAPPAVVQKSHALEGDSPWLWLYEIETDDDGNRLRLVFHPEKIVFRGVTYFPANVAHNPLEDDSEGTIGVQEISLGALSDEILAIAEAADLEDRPVLVLLVHKAELADPVHALEWAYTVDESAIDEETQSISIKVGNENPQQEPVPRRVFSRYRCLHAYKDELCGYVGPFATCDHTLRGSNGCVAHGDEEVSRGLARKHPSRFGGEPGILQE